MDAPLKRHDWMQPLGHSQVTPDGRVLGDTAHSAGHTERRERTGARWWFEQGRKYTRKKQNEN